MGTKMMAPHTALAVVDDGDGSLVARSCAGDHVAFEALHARYRRTVFNVCLKYLRDPAQAEDVVQDTFLRAYQNLDRFDTQKKMLPWLLSIAIRRCIDLQRRGARTAIKDPEDDVWGSLSASDTTVDRVLAEEERERLERALETLPWRQRRALLLYAVEGWTYADIASAEGTSIETTKSLLWRARSNLRKLAEAGALGVFLPLRALWRRGRGTAAPGNTSVATAVQSFSAIAALLAVTFAPTAPRAPSIDDPMRLDDRAVTRLAVNEDHPGARAAVSGGNAIADQTVADPRRHRDLQQELLDPTGDATPEDTHFTSIVPSPAFARDRTMFAAGDVPCQRQVCPALFVTRDGGASWNKLTATGFAGGTILLPPRWPADARLFAMGPAGLQLSVDRGATFVTLTPVTGSAAISPLFGTGDERLLIGTAAILEYLADEGVVKPATLIPPTSGVVSQVAFSPDYALDQTVFVGGTSPGADLRFDAIVNRCAGSVCTSVVLPGATGAPQLRFSPSYRSDRTLMAFTADGIFLSRDGGVGFTRLEGIPDAVTDVAFARGSIVASVGGRAGGVFMLDPRGAWTRSELSLPWFAIGAQNVLARDGLIVASGTRRGLACSADGGTVWTPRCPAT